MYTVVGWCNAHSELNDPIDQRERFAAQEEAPFTAGDEEANHTDEDFLNALGSVCRQQVESDTNRQTGNVTDRCTGYS